MNPHNCPTKSPTKTPAKPPVPWTEKRRIIAAALRVQADRIEHRAHEEIDMKEIGKVVNGLIGVIADRDAKIKKLEAEVATANTAAGAAIAAAPDPDDTAALAAGEQILAANTPPAGGSNSTGV